MPRVLNKYKDDCTNAVYIGRPTKWGNPFVIGSDGTREEVVEKYARWLLTKPDLIKDAKSELKGRNLMCFCSPCLCHGDVLLIIANED